MGHIRIGEFPKTRRWSHVVRLMDDPDVDVGIVARAVVAAAEKAVGVENPDSITQRVRGTRG